MDPPPPPHSHSSSSSTSFPILAISILGILATAILLLSYYLFIIKCCLNWRLRRSPFLPFRSPSLRRHRHRHRPSVDPVRPDRAPRGLDDSAIRSIPTLRYARTNTTAKPVECAVCLAELEDRELLRLLPGCGHSFHIDCIDTWLQSSANCPLCRFDVSRVPIHNYLPLPVASDAAVEATDITAAAPPPPPPTTTTTPKPSRKFWQAASMGDECIDIGRSREKDESFAVQPIRRSFSMDSSNDRALFLSVQDVLQQNCRELVVLDARRGEGSCSGDGGGSNACGRIRRSFFSFGRSSRSATAVLPVQSELC